MREAYIIYPDVCLDALDKDSNENTYSKLFLGELLKEKWRVCTPQTKNYLGFISDFHWKQLVKIILNLLDKVNNDEINVIQLVLASIERDGIEDYPYMDNFTPLLDLATDKSDTYEIKIICNNQTITSKIKEFMRENSHLGTYHIYTAKECYLHLINK